MVKRVQRVRHDSVDADLFVGLVGELTIDLTNNNVRVHDGTTAGGHTLPNLQYIQTNFAVRNTAWLDLNINEAEFNNTLLDRDFIVNTLALPSALAVDGNTGLTSFHGAAHFFGAVTFDVAPTGIGSFQPLDADLTSIATTGSAANKLTYWTGVATSALTDLSAFARTYLDDADAVTTRATLGLVIGTNVQAFDADLSAIAALAGTGFATQTGAGTWANRSLANGLGIAAITNPAGVAGNPSIAIDTAVVPQLAVANTFSASNQTIVWADSGGTAGPILNVDRNSTSPTGGDFLGQIKFTGRNTTPSFWEYGSIIATIVDATPGSEDGAFAFSTPVAGVNAVRWWFGQGFWTANATGGDPGVDKINCKGVLVDNVALPQLNVANVWTRPQRHAWTAITDQATLAWDMDVATYASVTVAANRTMGLPTNIRDGQEVKIKVGASGAFSINSWNAAFDFGASGAPTGTATSGKFDIYSFVGVGTTKLNYQGIQKGFNQ